MTPQAAVAAVDAAAAVADSSSLQALQPQSQSQSQATTLPTPRSTSDHLLRPPSPSHLFPPPLAQLWMTAGAEVGSGHADAMGQLGEQARLLSFASSYPVAQVSPVAVAVAVDWGAAQTAGAHDAFVPAQLPHSPSPSPHASKPSELQYQYA